MPVTSIVTALLAGITLSVGILHLIGWLRGWATRRHLTFALTCFAIVLYDFGCSGLYAADSPGEGVLWQRTESLALLLAMMFRIGVRTSSASWPRTAVVPIRTRASKDERQTNPPDTCACLLMEILPPNVAANPFHFNRHCLYYSVPRRC